MNCEPVKDETEVYSWQIELKPSRRDLVSQRRREWFRAVFFNSLKWLAQVLIVLGLICASYFFFSSFVVQSVQVAGSSMLPTLQPSKSYLLDRWTYLTREPQPFDIVVIRDPEDNALCVKRVIGGAGDSIYLKNGHVFINGRRLDEPYLAPGTLTYGMLNKIGEQWTLCGQDYFFVLGDNRGNSMDSRVFGPVRRENILGTVVP